VSSAGAQAERGASVTRIAVEGLSDQYPTATGGRQREKRPQAVTFACPRTRCVDHATGAAKPKARQGLAPQGCLSRCACLCRRGQSHPETEIFSLENGSPFKTLPERQVAARLFDHIAQQINEAVYVSDVAIGDHSATYSRSVFMPVSEVAFDREGNLIDPFGKIRRGEFIVSKDEAKPQAVSACLPGLDQSTMRPGRMCAVRQGQPVRQR